MITTDKGYKKIEGSDYITDAFSTANSAFNSNIDLTEQLFLQNDARSDSLSVSIDAKPDIPVSISNGGTGATTKSQARSNLGVLADDTVPVEKGGTGATTPLDALANLGAMPDSVVPVDKGGTGASSASTALANLGAMRDTTVPVSKGGTGATTSAQALTNLGAMPDSVVPVDKGGTGATGAAQARQNLGLDGVSVSNSAFIPHSNDALSLGSHSNKWKDVYTGDLYPDNPLALSRGGTGSTSAVDALENLGAMPIKPEAIELCNKIEFYNHGNYDSFSTAYISDDVDDSELRILTKGNNMIFNVRGSSYNGVQLDGPDAVFMPVSDYGYNLGKQDVRWDNGYFGTLHSVNGTVQTSDITKKSNITPVDPVKVVEFINALKPIHYTLNDDASLNIHCGLGAQDVKLAMDASGLTDFGGYVEQELLSNSSSESHERETFYGLNYYEFIAPIITMLQQLHSRVVSLESQIAELKK